MWKTLSEVSKDSEDKIDVYYRHEKRMPLRKTLKEYGIHSSPQFKQFVVDALPTRSDIEDYNKGATINKKIILLQNEINALENLNYKRGFTDYEYHNLFFVYLPIMLIVIYLLRLTVWSFKVTFTEKVTK